MDRLHEIASKRLEEMKIAKQTLVELKHANKKPTKRREKVEVIMEENIATEQNNAALEEN